MISFVIVLHFASVSLFDRSKLPSMYQIINVKLMYEILNTWYNSMYYICIYVQIYYCRIHKGLNPSVCL